MVAKNLRGFRAPKPEGKAGCGPLCGFAPPFIHAPRFDAKEARLMPSAAVIVAHPDDESLWCGGLMLRHPTWDWFVFTLCRGGDPDRARRFGHVLNYLGAHGAMADLDDGTEQAPLEPERVCNTIVENLPRDAYDLVLTHGPRGEYTRHRRHEECCRAVVSLWATGQIKTSEMKLFAYHDEGGSILPQVSADADERDVLDTQTFVRKRHIITHLYGFHTESWEARTTPAIEGFYRADTPSRLSARLQRQASAVPV